MSRFTRSAFLMLMTVSLFGGAAHAGPCGDNSDTDAVLCSIVLVSASPSATTSGLLDSTSSDDRETYLNQLRDDSAAFVAQDGEVAPGPALGNAIARIRAKDPKAAQMTDVQIAAILMTLN
jgi:uncharacterized protein (TIGR02448 family)